MAQRFVVVDHRPRPWFEVETDVVDRYIAKLSSDAFKLLILLARLNGMEPEQLPELDFERLLNFSPKQVLFAVAELKREGLLEIDRTNTIALYGLTSAEEREAVHERTS